MSNAGIHFLECQHCFSNVMFRSDGICPSCRKNRFDTQGIDPGKTMVTIDHNHRLPACCFLCGEATPLRKKLIWSYNKQTALDPLAQLLSYLPGSGNREKHRINMPVCAPCLPLSKQSKPISMVAGLDCRLVVHRNFRRQFEKLNGTEYLEWQADIRIDNTPRKQVRTRLLSR